MALAAAWLLAAASATALPSFAAPVSKYLLLDPGLVVEGGEGVQTVFAEMGKAAVNPMVCEDRPWEQTFRHMYASVMRNGTSGDWLCYYASWLVWPGSSSRIGGTLLATSSDGLTWAKPALHRVTLGNSSDNNVVLAQREACEGNLGVLRDEGDPDPSRRFKAFGCFSNSYGSRLGVSASPDGLAWSPAVQVGDAVLEGRTGGDTYNSLFSGDAPGSYLAATRLDVNGERNSAVSAVPPGGLLAPSRWPAASVALNDGAGNTSWQVYGLRPFRYGHLWLGFVVDYETATGKMLSGLAASYDGLKWWRVLPPGVELVPLGPEGSFDSHMTYLSVPPIVDDEGVMRVYYSGANGPHGSASNYTVRRTCLGLASARVDRLAGLWSTPQNRHTPVEVTTRAVNCTGRVLRVSADAASGFVQAGLHNGPPGLGVDHSVPQTGSLVDAPVRFAGGADFAAFVGKPVQVKLRFASAVAYSFSFADE